MRVKNWKKFQHFRDRTPPWIKFHKEILDQRDINALSDWSYRVLTYLWLVASEDYDKEGKITDDIEELAFRFRCTEEKLAQALVTLDRFILDLDIKAISERYQLGHPEERRGEESRGETEAEDIKRGENKKPRSLKFKPPTIEEINKYCQERKNGLDAETFHSFYNSKNWMVGKNKMKCWKSCIITWEKRKKQEGGNGKTTKSDAVHKELWGEETDHAVAKDLDNEKHRVIDVTPSGLLSET